MTPLPTARTCALCGAGQSARKGGLAAFGIVVRFALERGVKLARPDSSYLHLRCARQLQSNK